MSTDGSNPNTTPQNQGRMHGLYRLIAATLRQSPDAIRAKLTGGGGGHEELMMKLAEYKGFMGRKKLKKHEQNPAGSKLARKASEHSLGVTRRGY